MPERLAGVVVALAVVLAACTPLGEPGGPQPTLAPTPTPTASADGTPVSAPSAPEASPTPSPSPSRDPSVPEPLELEVVGCPGGVVVDWSATSHAEFHHYIALRSIEPDVNTAYPPIAPAVDWGDSYVTDRFITSAVDTTVIPSETTLFYRVMAYDLRDRVLAASEVRSTTGLSEVVDLGPLDVAPDLEVERGTHLDWELFGGLGRCFTAYQVLIGPAGSAPSSTLTLVAEQATSDLTTTGLASGQTYTIRVDAIRSTTLGTFAVGQSEVTTYTVP